MEQPIESRVRQPRRTIAQIKRLLGLFEQGGITGSDFCKQHNIDKSTFYKWKSRYGVRGEKKKQDHAGFAKVEVVPSPAAPALFAEVAGIRIYQPVPASFLKELLP